jgi:uncharacterized protein YdeI (YjbR/CyaY-like superfamily)
MKNPQVDVFIDKVKKWEPELSKLRSIALECQLEEGYKWKHPCYMYQDKNIFLIHGFKEYCAILFMKGALLMMEKNYFTNRRIMSNLAGKFVLPV